jgi:hypothetical protein
MVDFYSALASGDAVFDVDLTSNCMGAAVLIYQLVERLDTVIPPISTEPKSRTFMQPWPDAALG